MRPELCGKCQHDGGGGCREDLQALSRRPRASLHNDGDSVVHQPSLADHQWDLYDSAHPIEEEECVTWGRH